MAENKDEVKSVEWVESLVQRANQLFDEAEKLGETSAAECGRKFREGINQLLRAFLYLHDANAAGDCLELFEACRRLDPEFDTIEPEIRLVATEGFVMAADADELADAANEVWDFIIDLISEEG